MSMCSHELARSPHQIAAVAGSKDSPSTGNFPGLRSHCKIMQGTHAGGLFRGMNTLYLSLTIDFLQRIFIGNSAKIYQIFSKNSATIGRISP